MAKKRISIRKVKKMAKKKLEIMIKESINKKQRNIIYSKISKRRRRRNIAKKVIRVISESASNQSNLTPSNKSKEKKVVLLPKDLLKKAQALAKINITKAIEIYDIDDDINYNYLIKCEKKINIMRNTFTL